MPTGLALGYTDTGQFALYGTPSVSEGGTEAFTLQAANGQTPRATQKLTLVIDTLPTFTSSASSMVTQGQTSTVTVSASGYPDPALTAIGLPSGVTLGSSSNDPSGGSTAALAVSTTVKAGVYPITLQASSTSGTATQALSLTVGSAPVIASPTSEGLVPGQLAAFTIAATGLPAPQVTVTTLPPGLVPTASTTGGDVLVEGTVAVATAGNYTAKVSAKNAEGTTTQTLHISVSTTGGPAITTPATGIAKFQVGTTGTTYKVAATAASIIKVHAGTLPPGLQFTAGPTGTATISGTPTAAGYWAVALSATRPGSTPGVAFVELQVFGPPVFTSGTTATFTEGQPGSFTVTATGLPPWPLPASPAHWRPDSPSPQTVTTARPRSRARRPRPDRSQSP